MEKPDIELHENALGSITAEMEKLLQSASNERIAGFLRTQGSLIWVKDGQERELAVNSQNELCYIEALGISKSLKLLRNFRAKDLKAESQKALAEYLRETEVIFNPITETTSMTKLAASIISAAPARKRLTMGTTHNLVVEVIYDTRKDHAENARKIYINVSNQIFSKDCNYYLSSGDYEEIKSETEIPSDLDLVGEIREQFEANPEVSIRFEQAKTPGKCLLVVRRKRKELK